MSYRIVWELWGTQSGGGGWIDKALLVERLVQMGVFDPSSLLMMVERAVLDESYWCSVCHRQSNFVSGSTWSKGGILLL